MENKIKKEPIQTVDCTPTWAGILPIHLHILMDCKSKPEGIKTSMAELQRMAKIADAYNEIVKDMKAIEQDSMESIESLIKVIDRLANVIEPGAKKVLDEIRQIIKDFKNEKREATNSDERLA